MSVREIIEKALYELTVEAMENATEEEQSNVSNYIVTIGSVPIDTVIKTEEELKDVIKRSAKGGATEIRVYELASITER